MTSTRISREEYPGHELRTDPTSSSTPASDRPTNPTATLVREKRLHGWNRFDVRLNLRNLRTYDDAAVPKKLYKLHWKRHHVLGIKMRHILQTATLEKARLDMRKPAVDTNSKCRAW